ncbi:uncharacterized protein PHACADRAFT_84501 [Phanerochaete carnosa HHB-10118-sp]|uniref:NADPH-dependent FMN reductase-like domain-containing protein n=1 Tax=Phanerochaete carnosa (strain HHB-10118-sp) TaxID=650164 RepID=K5VDN4_PHACS|nr:uncharacterized protein PHACADRAFT_84501 [Phanerochaete carnosa HHB-10118-sp]EKM61096.1 hypothetical protein PHACADRAFT_84501 [Phanerochaete carnosa HHB-10118-sp]
MQVATRLGLLIGSSRNGGNGHGLAAWLTQILDDRLNAPGSANVVEIVAVDPREPPHPFGPVVDGSKLPSQVPDPFAYASPAIREWSRFVTSCAGFAIVTPEYNGGYPGELKNALDHLYKEWAEKPVALVTYGGGGGASCQTQLQVVLNALKMRVVPDPVGIRLPRAYTGGSERVSSTGSFPDFLDPYVGAVQGTADRLREMLFEKPVNNQWYAPPRLIACLILTADMACSRRSVRTHTASHRTMATGNEALTVCCNEVANWNPCLTRGSGT